MNPTTLSLFWWNTWKDHIRQAHECPDLSLGYSMAAAIAQMEYLTYGASESWKE